MNGDAFGMFYDIQAWFTRYKQYLYTASVAAIALAGGGYFFWNYRQQQYNSAYSALSQGYEDLMRAYEKPQAWEDVELAGQAGIRSYDSTVLAPYFYALQAEAQIHADNLDDAIASMKKASEGLSQSNALYYPFKIKYAQMQMAHDNAAIAQEGLSLLQKLAEDEKNPQQDQALFYAGYHYWLMNNRSEAFRYWSTLREKFGSDQEFPSPWTQVIEDFTLDVE